MLFFLSSKSFLFLCHFFSLMCEIHQNILLTLVNLVIKYVLLSVILFRSGTSKLTSILCFPLTPLKIKGNYKILFQLGIVNCMNQMKIKSHHKSIYRQHLDRNHSK